MKNARSGVVTVLLSVAAITFGPAAARAGSDEAGTTAANFLTLGSGAGIQGRAGATLALWGDVTTAAWNAAALGWLRETEVSLSHATLLEEQSQDFMAMGGRLGGSDLRWAISGLYASEGTFAGRDALNNPTENFSVSRFAGGGLIAYPIANLVSLGVGAKWVNESLGETRGSGLTFDFGLQGRFGPVGLGLAAQNAFGTMRYDGQSFDFPTNYGAGVALDLPEAGLRLAVDANFPSAYFSDVRTGVEWRWRDLIALRGGYRAELGAGAGEALSGPSFGFGTGVYGMWLDYAYVIPGAGDSQHRLGISLRPGRLGDARAFGSVTSDNETAPKSEKPAKPRVAKAAPPVTTEPEVVDPAKPKPIPVKKVAPTPKVETPAAAPVEPPPVAPPAVTPPPPAIPPQIESPPPVTPPAPGPRPKAIKVRAGETLEEICKRWQVSVPAMMMENDMVSTEVEEGRVLKLPPKGS